MPSLKGKVKYKVWFFVSESAAKKKARGKTTKDPTTHQTIAYWDGDTSCSCKGWTQRSGAGDYRECKHTRWAEAGLADSECVRGMLYDGNGENPQPFDRSDGIAVLPMASRAPESNSFATPTIRGRSIVLDDDGGL